MSKISTEMKFNLVQVVTKLKAQLLIGFDKTNTTCIYRSFIYIKRRRKETVASFPLIKNGCNVRSHLYY